MTVLSVTAVFVFPFAVLVGMLGMQVVESRSERRHSGNRWHNWNRRHSGSRQVSTVSRPDRPVERTSARNAGVAARIRSDD